MRNSCFFDLEGLTSLRRSGRRHADFLFFQFGRPDRLASLPAVACGSHSFPDLEGLTGLRRSEWRHVEFLFFQFGGLAPDGTAYAASFRTNIKASGQDMKAPGRT